MNNTVTSIDRASLREKHITAFSAVKQEYGLKIEVRGCVKLLPTQNLSNNVIGILEFSDQTIPILDSRKNISEEITDLSCILILENHIEETTIMTGRLYESSSKVFDLLVEQMDSPAPPNNPQESHKASKEGAVPYSPIC